MSNYIDSHGQRRYNKHVKENAMNSDVQRIAVV